MPGHVKKGKPGEADPDPSEYLIVSLEMKREDQSVKTKKSQRRLSFPYGSGNLIISYLFVRFINCKF